MTLRHSVPELVRLAEEEGKAALVARAPHWSRVSLGDVARVINGAAYKSAHFNLDGRGMPLLRIRDVGVRSVGTWYDGPWEATHLVRRGDLVVGMDGDFKSATWDLEDALLNQRVCRIDVDASRMEPRFLQHALPGYLDLIWQATSAVTVKHLSSRSIAEIPLPFPDLMEQRRIVEILEEHLSHLDAADAELHWAQSRSDALLLAALRSHVESLRSTGTRFARVGEVASTTLGKMLDAKKSSGEPTPYLANINVRWGGFDLEKLKLVPLTTEERRRLTMLPGDVIVCEGGEPGRCAVWDREDSGVAYQKALHRVRVHDRQQLRPEYLALMLRETIQSGRADRLFTGTTIKHLPQEKLRLIEIPLPGSSVQVAALGELGAVAQSSHRLTAALDAAKSRSAALRRAVLAAAFEGKLTGRHTDAEVIEELAQG